MLNPDEAARVCIYAIRHSDALRQAERDGGGEWTEQSAWVSAAAELKNAEDAGEWLPLFLAAADRSSGLLFVARLDTIRVEHTNIDYTRFAFSDVRRLPTPAPPISSLRVVSTDEPLSRDFIRSYAICKTPRELLFATL